METEILEESSEHQTSSMMEAIKWWEKRRVWFNVAVGLSGLISILFLFPMFNLYDILGIIFYGIAANVFYSFGFVLEALNLHYLNGRIEMSKYRMALFLIGTLFSCLVTFVAGIVYYSLATSPF